MGVRAFRKNVISHKEKAATFSPAFCHSSKIIHVLTWTAMKCHILLKY